MNVDPPWRLDPFQNIVGVSWGADESTATESEVDDNGDYWALGAPNPAGPPPGGDSRGVHPTWAAAAFPQPPTDPLPTAGGVWERGKNYGGTDDPLFVQPGIFVVTRFASGAALWEITFTARTLDTDGGQVGINEDLRPYLEGRTMRVGAAEVSTDQTEEDWPVGSWGDVVLGGGSYDSGTGVTRFFDFRPSGPFFDLLDITGTKYYLHIIDD